MAITLKDQQKEVLVALEKVIKMIEHMDTGNGNDAGGVHSGDVTVKGISDINIMDVIERYVKSAFDFTYTKIWDTDNCVLAPGITEPTCKTRQDIAEELNKCYCSTGIGKMANDTVWLLLTKKCCIGKPLVEEIVGDITRRALELR